MAAGRGDLERALGRGLPAHVREVAVRLRVGPIGPRRSGVPKLVAVAEDDRDRVGERLDGVQIEPVDERRLARVHARHDHPGESGVARGQHHRQDAAHGAHAAVEREFAERDELLQREPIDLFVDRDQRERDRQLERRAFLADVGRREVDEQSPRRKREAAVEDR